MQVHEQSVHSIKVTVMGDLSAFEIIGPYCFEKEKNSHIVTYFWMIMRNAYGDRDT